MHAPCQLDKSFHINGLRGFMDFCLTIWSKTEQKIRPGCGTAVRPEPKQCSARVTERLYRDDDFVGDLVAVFGLLL